MGPVQELGGVSRSRERAVLAGAELSIACLTALGWVLSYSTLQRLAASHGYSGWEARLWPLTVDFLVLASTLIAMLTARRGQRPHRGGLAAGRRGHGGHAGRQCPRGRG